MHSCPNKIDTTIDSFPTAFAIPVGVVNLIQGYWCLDHGDYEVSINVIFKYSNYARFCLTFIATSSQFTLTAGNISC